MRDTSVMNVESTGRVMMVSVILLLMVLLLVIALHLYVRWFWRRPELESSYPEAPSVATPRSPVIAAASDTDLGLDPKVLGSLPVVIFCRDEFRDGLECAVCLCEVVHGEKARVLPRCRHGFHVECIDMWLRSHVTCPLCRKNVVDEESSRKEVVVVDVSGGSGSNQDGDGAQNSDLSPSFPTNVLFWGNETQVSSGSNNACLEDGNTPSSSSEGSSRMNTNGSSRHTGLVIAIPVHAGENLGLRSEETKSPVQARLGSLRRLLSRDRDRRVAPSTHGETQAAVDVEMGLRGQPC
ncbi:hypothetical protein MLD38_007137 [Melastoma candidum]|uniref:Uncharacterized protein n=1 Tax=Melastoma candidum TaxID=119954 RepID=A0ACB9RTX1_9MYRT|nr:hypothetical protein MLD38_007137 [Melastoma candidum]